MPIIPTARSSAPARWHQESMLPPDVLEITVRLGVVCSSDHLQAQIEAREADGRLVAMWSMPACRLSDLSRVLDLAVEEVKTLVHPF